ncbi:creatininase family protein [Longitalea luteola]|uniref:creatininase family protein n=1 Tax=Longitalea luteola TaxID=2812563 RepID=UPI001A96A2AA|nr:creatininase family protein [Longitalea luteola]
MIWDQLTSSQIAATDRNIPVILPLTATEQHGPHLPLATDRMIAEHFIYSLNAEMNDKILVLPSIYVGCSHHHIDFAGTLSLDHTTFLAIVKNMVRAVLHHGFHKIILFNSHGGNQGIMTVIMEQLGFENAHAHFFAATWWAMAREALMQVSETGRGGTGHACEFETSLMLLIAEKLVDKAKIEPGANAPTFEWAEGDMLYGSAASYFRMIKTMTPNGIYGDPTKASAEKGRKITDCVLRSLKQMVTDIYKMNTT